MVLARCLMLIDIYMKFGEDILNGFQVIERYDFVIESKGNNSKSIKCKCYGSCFLHVI